MSRIRTIKPEFWTSEQVVSCSPHARLLFIGLWNFCDDHGVHPASYVRLKAEVFPVDSFTIDEVKNWINELVTYDLLHEYVVDNKAYWMVTGWRHHQRIDKPTYRYPIPPSFNNITDNSSNIQREIADDSTIITRRCAESSFTDRNGMDRSGREKDRSEVETSPLTISNKLQSTHSVDDPARRKVKY